MQAILFPHTFIHENLCKAVGSCFRPVRIYQPIQRQVPPQMQALSQKRLIEIAIPAQGDDKKIETFVRDYRRWAELHQGGLLDYLKWQRGSTPFFDDTSTAQIRADILRGGRASAGQDPVFNARVFLHLAQEYDQQSDEIARKLDTTCQAERNLFKNLAGPGQVPLPGALQPPTGAEKDLAGFMIVPRMLAWAQLFLLDSGLDAAAGRSAFITAQREALDLLLQKSPDVEPVIQAAAVPVLDPLSREYGAWQRQWGQIFDSLPENADDLAVDLCARMRQAHPSSPAAELTLYRLPGEPAAALFARCVDRPLPEFKAQACRDRDETLIGLIEVG